MSFFIAILFFFLGCVFANWRNKKKLEIARLVGIRNFVHGYCENLQGMCNSMLEKVKTEELDDEEKTRYAHMLAVISNIHDELVEIWKSDGENKLTELLQETISDKEVFGKTLDKKMRDLVAFEDELNVDDYEKGLKLISENFSLIGEIKSWVKDYSSSQNSYIKTAAIETIALLEAKEAVLKMIETGVKTNRNTPGEEAKETFEKQIYHTERYANAMQLLFES